ncbi:MAG: DNA translocase FtsK [Aerococcaceae bacterium]|nr:DNA translocase FtsK [Aerococcaceae bacterium]
MAKKKQKQKQIVEPYQPTYLLIGMAIIFFATLALFKWGAFGMLIANSFRLLVGEPYYLLVGGLYAVAAFMVVKGQLYNPNLRLLSGTLLVLSALTTLWHVNTFYPQEPLPSHIFSETFQVFQKDLMANQTSYALGGGMLGAFFYMSFSYLFGKWGTYLLAILLLALGVGLLARVQPATVQQGFVWLKEKVASLWHNLFPKQEGSRKVAGPSFFDKILDVFNGEVEDEEFFEEALPIEYEPAFEVPASETVLDMDYFEAMEAEPQPVEVPIEVVTPKLEDEPVHAANHWQSYAHQTQDLTTDALDEVLATHETEQPAIKKPRTTAKTYRLPGKELLTKIPPVDQSEEYARINENIKKLEQTFDSFGVKANVVKANLGPSVTKYEIQPAVGVKVSKIVSLADDIALALAARDVRMEAPIPGKSLIGIEVPNHQVSPVSFWEIIDAALESPNILEVPLGRDISGTVCLADLSKMPHLLIAGATGSGKSVGMNGIIISLLMKAKPEEVKFLMIDPKKVELSVYNDIPHLLAPVVTNPRKAAQALNKVVQEMERRYELFAATGMKNLDGYNEQVDRYNKENGTGYERLPKIVVFVDELADLMMVASNDVETAIIRLAQMARAAGIHMIIATQRPSVDVLTGIIKANVPSRLAFAVSSGIDSRTILDSTGAEKLLGRGDMLFQPMGKNKPVRVQGAYLSEAEVDRIVEFIKAQSEANYDETMMALDDASEQPGQSDDEYFDEAVEMARSVETISISQLQRRFRIGYNRAARLIDDMEAQGIVASQDGSRPRQVLISEND